MKKRKSVVSFFKEIAIVVIGVLIAISLNNIKENSDNKNYIQKTMLAMEKDIQSSKNDLEDVLNKHLALAQNLEDLDEVNQQSLAELIGELGGVQFASIKNISLRFFISNKAELLDYELIAQLSEIEIQSDILSDKMDRLANHSVQHLNSTDMKDKIIFTYLLLEVIDSEKTLLQFYSSFLNKKTQLLN